MWWYDYGNLSLARGSHGSDLGVGGPRRPTRTYAARIAAYEPRAKFCPAVEQRRGHIEAPRKAEK